MSIYKTRMHQNSLVAHDSIEQTKIGARDKVFSCICANQGVTRQQLAIILGWPINRVTGRVKELLDAGQIEERGTEMVGGRPRARLWRRMPDEHGQG
jgi:chromosome segregation and condensation protein ScpB